MEGFGQGVKFPDFWQAEALSALRAGRDVVLHAPTGAGKTYVFELFYTRHFRGRSAVYTVPTRALANDKFREWRARGWNVGISTGDLSLNPSAPLVVATLETQKSRILGGRAADFMAIDEYQLIGDPRRGANYELAIAMAPPETQLLLLSGSVENRGEVAAWLRRLGRDAALVEHGSRPVPLEEVFSESLSNETSYSARGAWGRLVKKIAAADMAPVLIFAPRRVDAETIASRIASELDGLPPLQLPRERLEGAGRRLAGLLKRRVAFHHSGLSARQRSGIVEACAKSGDLVAVVATTGLGAGVNFSMRSVIIADREYESMGQVQVLRPDEMLQMYGRAGRRGLDTCGYAISLPGKPRLSEAGEIRLGRCGHLDWTAVLRVMDAAASSGGDHLAAARRFLSRLFTEENIDLGFDRAAASPCGRGGRARSGERVEMLNSAGLWERRKPSCQARLCEALYHGPDGWVPFLESRRAVLDLGRGAACAVGGGRYGVRVRVASRLENGFYRLTRAVYSALCPLLADCDRALSSGGGASLRTLRRRFSKYVPSLFWGAELAGFEDRGGALFALLDVSNSKIGAVRDGEGALLANPPLRRVRVQNANDFGALSGFGPTAVPSSASPAELWLRFGLVDSEMRPTVRGRIFSFFNGGEGLAIAAALEDESYSVGEIFYDMANLRAGRRFAMSSKIRSSSSRLADVCALKYSLSDVPGYLRRGVPPGYGEGASEIVRKIAAGGSFAGLEDDVLRRGDIERAWLEWKSIVRHAASCPDVDDARFMELKALCASESSAW